MHQKRLYIPLHFANISLYQPSPFGFAAAVSVLIPTVLSLHVHPKVSRISPKGKKVTIFLFLSSQTVGCFGIMFISCFLTAGTKISSDGKIRNPKYFG